MGTTLRTRLSRLAKGTHEGAQLPLSPVPEGAEAKLPESDGGENGVDDKNGDNSGPCGENGGSQETFTSSTKCEHEESVTEIADAVVDPHETDSVYGDVLSHLIALPFESQSMLKFHQVKESSKAKDGRRKRKKPRKNTIPIYSQKQYLRGRGLMPLSLAEKEVKKKKKKSRAVKTSPKREPVILHSNRTEWAEFSPRPVKTRESPKRGVSQSPRQQDVTNIEHLNSYNGQDMTAIQEEALAQAQQHQLFINDQRDIASLHQEQELQLLLQQQQQQQQLHHQQPAYYDPLQAVHHHLYNQMLMSYPFNPYQPYQQPGYQHISPELLQPFVHGGYVNNPDDVLAAAITAAAVANRNDPLHQTGFAGYPSNNESGAEAVYRNAHLPPEYHDYAAAAPAAPPTVNHDTTTPNSEPKPTKSKKQVVAALPQASKPTVDNDKSNVDAEVCTAKRTVQDEDVANKMKMKKSEAEPKKEARREKLTKASSDKPEMKDNAKVVHSPKVKQTGQNSDNCVGNSAGAEFPQGWTTSMHPRKTGRGFNSHFVSPNNTTFRSRKSAIAFIAILAELKKQNDGKDPSESEALAVFDRRGNKR